MNRHRATSICGYLVVEIPGENRLEHLHTESLTYRGLRRNAWEYISKCFYEDKDTEAGAYWEYVNSLPFNDDVTGIYVVKDLPVARDIRLASNAHTDIEHEVIAIHSKDLRKYKGEKQVPAGEICWIGYDPICSWSLAAWLIEKPKTRRRARKIFNQYGLMNQSESFAAVVDFYDEAVENVGTGPDGLDPRLDAEAVFCDPVKIGLVESGGPNE